VRNDGFQVLSCLTHKSQHPDGLLSSRLTSSDAFPALFVFIFFFFSHQSAKPELLTQHQTQLLNNSTIQGPTGLLSIHVCRAPCRELAPLGELPSLPLIFLAVKN